MSQMLKIMRMGAKIADLKKENMRIVAVCSDREEGYRRKIVGLEKQINDLRSLKDEELMCLETEFNTFKSEAIELLRWALHSDPEHDNLVDFDAKWKEAEAFIKEYEIREDRLCEHCDEYKSFPDGKRCRTCDDGSKWKRG